MSSIGHCEDVEISSYTAGDKVSGAAALENSLAIPKNIKHTVSIDPVVPLLGTYPI